MKIITLVFHPDDLSDAKKHLNTLEGFYISDFMFRMVVEHSEVESAINGLEYVLTGIDYIVKVH
jgi:hypothetical protein